jgi:fido (protein-threonine AMPylation protein)
MPKYSNNDHYIDPETGILKNLLGITDEAELEKAEATFASIRSYELVQTPVKGSFDLEHLKAIHYYIFKDLYAWAGQCRDINISKGDAFFAHYAHIEVAAKAVFDRLAQECCLNGLAKHDFCDRAALYLGEINALHPLREGNGRAQREFISHLGYANGYYIEWKNTDQAEMTEASIASFKYGDASKLAAYLRANIKYLDENSESES